MTANFIVVIIFAYLASETNALTCYSCGGAEGNDPYNCLTVNSKTRTETFPSLPICYSFSYTLNGIKIVARSPGMRGSCSNAEQYSKPAGAKNFNCEECTSDKCNNAPLASESSSLTCYKCEGALYADPQNCITVNSNTPTVTTSSPSICYSFSYTLNGIENAGRDGGVSGSCSTAQNVLPTGAIDFNCKECTSDKCNNAPLASESSLLTCYKCGGALYADPQNCLTVNSNTPTVTTSRPSICYSFSYTLNGIKGVGRDGGVSGSCSIAQNVLSTGAIDFNCKECNSDRCNSDKCNSDKCNSAKRIFSLSNQLRINGFVLMAISTFFSIK